MSKIQQQSPTTSPTKIIKHWSQKKHETVLTSDVIKNSLFQDAIQGGSDNGQFIYINKTYNTERLQFISGKLLSNEIILEMQNYKISGYTLYDVQLLLQQILKTYATITFVTVKSNTLPIDLRTYLDERFQKGSIDYELQQTIRENVYMRTVPCTTRFARPGEVNGQDYIFLTNNEFLELEKHGDLLEYGVYNGHYYGTPKPPKEPQKAGLLPSQIHANINGGDPSNGFNRLNSNSSSNMNHTNDTSPVNNHQLLQPSSSSSSSMLQNAIQLNNNDGEVIPFGWQKVEDAEYGTFYIDHINKQTTYENPLLHQQQQQQKPQIINNATTSSSSLKTFKPSKQEGENTNSSSGGGMNQFKQQQQQKNIFFTRNPNELKGDFLKTTLVKTNQGFGFTIIGANETSEDFLQINHIVPNGAADLDNILRHGDILVYVNSECVLGYTHQDVVEMFQSIPIGDYVEMTVCRGYPLSIDFNDPNIEIKSLPAINKDEIPQQQQQEMVMTEEDDYIDIFTSIVKGPMGFGFTIADDAANGQQKVKQILDRERCVQLLENDVLCEINNIQLMNLTHNQIVEILKECPKGTETFLKLKRLKMNQLVNNKVDQQQKQATITKSCHYQQPQLPLNGLNTLNIINQNGRSKTPNSTATEQILRSKTPDPRYSQPQPQQVASVNKQTENYYYLNQVQHPPPQPPPQNHHKISQSKSVTALSSLANQGTGPSNTNNLIFNPQDLYSTINKNDSSSSTTAVNINQLKENHQMFSDEYDSNLMKNNNRTNSTTLRSKTPGPELFRDRTNLNNMSANNINFRPQHLQFDDQISNTNKYNTISSSSQQQRSKTPTADLYYSQNQRNDNNFDTIYQPFIARHQQQQQSNDIYGNIEYKTIDIIVELSRQENGFGFRIVGGDEEGSQVAVGFIVPNGSADLDGRLKPNDEIIMIDNENVVGASHKRVVKLMTIAALNRKVKLWVKRKVPIPIENSPYPYTITLFRNGNEGFGFVIISTLNRSGPSIGEKQNEDPCSWIGKIVENSPAERCGRLKIGDRILAVNNIDITQMNHVDIVKLIKESGNSITLSIGPPIDEPLVLSSNNSPIISRMPSNYEIAPMPPSRIDSKNIIKSITPTTSKSRIIQPQQLSPPLPPPAKLTSSQGEYHLIELRKQSNTGFGFSIRGGREFNIPIFVLKLADAGPASIDGRLRVGDQILEINGSDAYNMPHNEAIDRIKSGGNIVSLLVRRTGLPPPSITDIIAATNNPVNSSNGNLNNISPTSMYTNTTSRPNVNNTNGFSYHQSDSTLLRPKSPYMNPDFIYLQQQQQMFLQQQQQQQFQQQQQQFQQQQQQRTTSSLSALTNRNF